MSLLHFLFGLIHQAIAAIMGAIRNRRSSQMRFLTQQLLPNPGHGGPLPDFVVPMVQQGQLWQHPGGRHAGSVHGQHLLMHHQMLSSHRIYNFPPGSNIAGGMVSDPNEGMRLPRWVLLADLDFASPAEQRDMLGEWVYPIVRRLVPEAAAKITGMFLELDRAYLVHLLDSPEAMRAKVVEAIEVLMDAFPEEFGHLVTYLLPSLSRADGV